MVGSIAWVRRATGYLRWREGQPARASYCECARNHMLPSCASIFEDGQARCRASSLAERASAYYEAQNYSSVNEDLLPEPRRISRAAAVDRDSRYREHGSSLLRLREYMFDRDGPLSDMMDEYCDDLGLNVAHTCFMHRGVPLDGTKTASQLSLGDRSEIVEICPGHTDAVFDMVSERCIDEGLLNEAHLDDLTDRSQLSATAAPGLPKAMLGHLQSLYVLPRDASWRRARWAPSR